MGMNNPRRIGSSRIASAQKEGQGHFTLAEL